MSQSNQLQQPPAPTTGFILPVATALALSCLVPWLLKLVFMCGNGTVPYLGPDLARDYSFGILWALVLAAGIFFWPVAPQERDALLKLWLVKVLVALVVMLAYEYRYGVDPDGYFNNAVDPDFIWKPLSFENGNQVIHDVTWLHLQLVPGSYHAAKVGFAMLGLLSIFLYYRAAVIILGRQELRILYILALFPSVLFWSSILGKDPFVLFGFSLYVHGIVGFQRLRRVSYLVPAAFGVLLCSLIRIWLVPITILPLGVFILAGKRSLLSRVVVLSAGVAALMGGVAALKERFRIATIDNLLDTRNYVTGAFEGGGSSITPPEVTSWGSAATALPQAIFNALFRPLPWDIPNLFGVVEGMGSVALLLLLAVALKRTRLSELKDPLLWWAIVLVLLWAALYGMVTYNLGSLVRYKLQVLPTLLGLLLYLGRKREPAHAVAPSPTA